MVTHEFARAVRTGASFPAMVPLDGAGTGFAVGGNGYVLTNYHMVTSEIGNAGREAGALHHEVRCRSLRAQIAGRTEDGAWTWHDAREVYLVSNPPSDRAIVAMAGRHELREDMALLRVVPSPQDFLTLSDAPPAVGAKVWMAGFPLRSARPPRRRSPRLTTRMRTAHFGFRRAKSLRPSYQTTSLQTSTVPWETAARPRSTQTAGSQACFRGQPVRVRGTRSNMVMFNASTSVPSWQSVGSSSPSSWAAMASVSRTPTNLIVGDWKRLGAKGMIDEYLQSRNSKACGPGARTRTCVSDGTHQCRVQGGWA